MWDLLRRLFARDNTWTGTQYINRWNDMRMSLLSARLPAANYPAFTTIATNGAGSTGIAGYSFDDGEYVYVTTQLSHDYAEGTTIYPHIHFHTTSNVSPADNFGIGIEYAWIAIGGTLGNTTVAEREISTGVNSSGVHQLAAIPVAGIAGTGKGISSIFECRLYRLAALTDNYADPVIITDFDLHFNQNTHGSAQATSK